MDKPLNPNLARRLNFYRLDFEQVTGKPFKHFHCPILGVDKPAELIRGHVVNRAFKDAPRAWVVQRSDVDNFYGSHFESGFELLQYRDGLTPVAMFTDQTLSKKLRPSIRIDGKPVVFTSQPSQLPGTFVRVELGKGPNAPAIGIRMNHQEMIESASKQWALAMLTDVRIPALVSLLKAAHLTLFHILGYRYALSAAGLYLGPDMLGRFYRMNAGRDKQEIQDNAWSYFREFATMFRPIVRGAGQVGTLTDRKHLVCHTTSGEIWAQIVVVNAGYQMHAVMIPEFSSADLAHTFLNFLDNDNEQIQVSTAEYDRRDERRVIISDRMQHLWPKRGFLYPQSPEPLRFPDDSK